MATIKWVTVVRRSCKIAGCEVELAEQRVYPADVFPEGAGYQVLARRCSQAIACNLAGRPCRWAYTNPVYDRLNLA